MMNKNTKLNNITSDSKTQQTNTTKIQTLEIKSGNNNKSINSYINKIANIILTTTGDFNIELKAYRKLII